VLDYVDGMHNAYAAADLVLCRSGAMTCAEVAAVGLPAVFVPLPIGNGEQALNAVPLVAAGAALVVRDDELTARYIVTTVAPLLHTQRRLDEMSAAARDLGHRDADERPADLVLKAAS
jgi:UDP-N-acetylglucosamine--N-acetylmuramyl-(pentapeptide) pyrophosphoryl-undecaprenol N-acetylglucosamine transferase